MKTIVRSLLAVTSLMGLTLSAQAAERISVVNAAGVKSDVVEQVRAYAESQLRVPVVVTNAAAIKGATLIDIGKAAASLKQSADACLIVLVIPEKASPIHAAMLTNELVTVVNVQALQTTNEAVLIRRLNRQVMRGAGFMFGLRPDPDPFCVMHDYRTLDDLDKMGMNFSPPWGIMFEKAAIERGLQVRKPQRPRPKKPMAMPPPPPMPAPKAPSAP